MHPNNTIAPDPPAQNCQILASGKYKSGKAKEWQAGELCVMWLD